MVCPSTAKLWFRLQNMVQANMSSGGEKTCLIHLFMSKKQYYYGNERLNRRRCVWHMFCGRVNKTIYGGGFKTGSRK